MSEDISEEASKRHQQACKEEKSFYKDPESGLFVMTAYYLKKQGSCCDSDCRHCPWPSEKEEE